MLEGKQTRNAQIMLAAGTYIAFNIYIYKYVNIEAPVAYIHIPGIHIIYIYSIIISLAIRQCAAWSSTWVTHNFPEQRRKPRKQKKPMHQVYIPGIFFLVSFCSRLNCYWFIHHQVLTMCNASFQWLMTPSTRWWWWWWGWCSHIIVTHSLPWSPACGHKTGRIAKCISMAENNTRY